jgi:nicotinamide-nucleotide amidase
MIAEIIAVGSEMLTPFRQDTNSLALTAELNLLGVQVAFKTIIGDSLAHLTDAAKIALTRADIVLFSGGLGPTEDDLTREAVAAALDLKLIRSEAILKRLKLRAAARKMPLTENNYRQADVLEGAESLPNANGSAPAQWLDTVYGEHRKLVILLPGPPKEQQPIFREQCVPLLREILPERFFAKRLLRIALAPESQVDARVSPIYKEFPDVETTILFHAGEIQLHFICAKHSLEEAQARVDELAERCEQELDDLVFSAQDQSLEEVVLLMLGMRHLTLATAESCTGGLIAERLTRIPGSSRSFRGGAVVYDDTLKTTFADVPEDMIHAHGAVSRQVARALAEGIRNRTGADLGLGITGIAGPGGATLNKPVGRVYIGLADAEGTEVKELNLSGDRERIRAFAAQNALDMLRRKLM